MTVRDLPSERISKKALSVWRIKAALEICVLLVLVVVLFIFTLRFAWPLYLPWIGVILLLLFSFWHVVIFPQWKWRKWRYAVYEKEIELLRGIFIEKHTVIPMNRVQHVDTEQGPIYKKFGLRAVTISTAAGVHEIPALTEETAQSLRDKIATLVGMDEEDE
ncbi:PH domain-containing protein [Aliibacillus thermotolerans]|uniref:PH domain-containing protein n=1 Tax=Aliibacillus thermotolerans TaxID=1834418 RepID=A0ABW0U453_9BACI|nr:PH domain-containing protein [Aliibacillus thermotolerans]